MEAVTDRSKNGEQGSKRSQMRFSHRRIWVAEERQARLKGPSTGSRTADGGGCGGPGRAGPRYLQGGLALQIYEQDGDEVSQLVSRTRHCCVGIVLVEKTAR